MHHSSTLGRRSFLEWVGALSLVGLGSKERYWEPCNAAGQPARTEHLTIEMIRGAERILGVDLTPDEREELLETLAGHIEDREGMYSQHVDEAIQPAAAFDPVPPGLQIESKNRPTTLSEIHVEAPSRVEDAAFLSVIELAELVRTQRVSSRDLTKMYIRRLRRFDEKLAFVVTITEDLALQQARKADEEIQAGRYRGPLHGIPYGIKDLFSVRGYPTTWGVGTFRDRVIDEDATVVRKLEEAGAVLIAKLSTGTMASGDEWFGGRTMNPWDADVGSGGSSAGPGAATAGGCVGFSIGTETNGSMVSPASECGVTGLRPTFGRVSRHGGLVVSWSFDKVTPMCRAVEDCAVVLEAIQGSDAFDTSVQDVPLNWDAGRDVSDLRLGYSQRFFDQELMGAPTSLWDIQYRKSIRSLSRRVLDFYEGLGMRPVPIDTDTPSSGFGYILEVEAAASMESLLRDETRPIAESKWQRKLRPYQFVSATEYLRALRLRTQCMQRMNEVFDQVDVIIEITWSNSWATNLTGHPLLVVPCGFYAPNRPTGITFIGKLYGEADLLAVAKLFQDSTDFHLRHPPETPLS